MIVLYTILIALLICYLFVQRKYYWLALKIRGPIGLPFIGNLELLSAQNLFVFASNFRKLYKDSSFTAWLGPICFLYVANPVNIERILTAPECINYTDLTVYISKFIGSGLLSSTNPEWSSHRKLLNPVFSTKYLFQFLSVFNLKTNNLCKQLKEYSKLKQSFHIDDILQDYTFSITNETILGKKCSMQYGTRNQIVLSYNRLIEALSTMIFNPLYRFSFITKLIDKDHHKKFHDALQNVTEFIKQCVEATIKRIQKEDENTLNPTDYTFIDHAVKLNMKGLFSKSEVISECNHFIVASYETTSKALLHIITLLATHPEWQEKLYKEIEDGFPDKEAELTFEDLQNTPLVDMIIKESLRLLPVLPFVGRSTSDDFVLFDDVVVPKGTNIAVDIFSMHRDPKYWGADANKFNPYRFSQDEVFQRHPYAYLPYNKGLRSCIGWKYANLLMKVFVIKIFRRFRLTSTTKLDEIDLIFNATIKMTQQPFFIIENRFN